MNVFALVINLYIFCPIRRFIFDCKMVWNNSDLYVTLVIGLGMAMLYQLPICVSSPSYSWDPFGTLGVPAGNNWLSIKADSSGKYAVAGTGEAGGVWFSTNYGQSWTQSTGSGAPTTTFQNRYWYQSLASSFSGQFIIAGYFYCGNGLC